MLWKKYTRTLRPSKQQFFYYLFQDAAKIPENSWIIDIASYNGQNSDIFKTRNYVAVDINLEILKKVKNSDYKIGVNILHLPFLKESFDAVISTHTLLHLKFNDRFLAIKELSEIVKPGGFLIFNMPLFDEQGKSFKLDRIKDIIGADFAAQRFVKYRGFISRLFEASIMLGFKGLKKPNLWISRIYMLSAILTFYLEYISQSYKVFSQEAYFCFKKKENKENSRRNFTDLFARLACPLDKTSLLMTNDKEFKCLRCNRIYKKKRRNNKFNIKLT